MTEASDTLPRRRRRAAKPTPPPPDTDPAVRAMLDRAVQDQAIEGQSVPDQVVPDPAMLDPTSGPTPGDVVSATPPGKPAKSRGSRTASSTPGGVSAGSSRARARGTKEAGAKDSGAKSTGGRGGRASANRASANRARPADGSEATASKPAGRRRGTTVVAGAATADDSSETKEVGVLVAASPLEPATSSPVPPTTVPDVAPVIDALARDAGSSGVERSGEPIAVVDADVHVPPAMQADAASAAPTSTDPTSTDEVSTEAPSSEAPSRGSIPVVDASTDPVSAGDDASGAGSEHPEQHGDPHHDDETPSQGGGDGGEDGGGHLPADPSASPSAQHHWVYGALLVFVLALGFGVWGVWTRWFSGDDTVGVAELQRRNDRLSQDIATLRRSDQISRDANRDLQRTLAERDEEIAGLRADVAFYERFVGATGQRRGLSVHDLEMKLQGGNVWRFVATLTQNVNRGAVNNGRVTLAIEGTRNDRLEKLNWSGLRKQNGAPGLGYSFKYFQQVEGEVMLPAGFKPLRVQVRLTPEGGNTVEQSFPWPDVVRGMPGG